MAKPNPIISLSDAILLCRDIQELYLKVREQWCKLANQHNHKESDPEQRDSIESCRDFVKRKTQEILIMREEIAEFTREQSETEAGQELIRLREEFLETNKLYVPPPVYEFKVNDGWYTTKSPFIEYESLVKASGLDDKDALIVAFSNKSIGSGKIKAGESIPLQVAEPTYFVVERL